MSSLEAAIAAARAHPDDVSAQVAAAYACDRAGDERQAIEFYDAAWRLGVPDSERAELIVGYGSTLRNVGRSAEAVTLLADHLRTHPDDHAARCFLALALLSAGRPAQALAEGLNVALDLRAAAPSIARYQRALTEYRDQLGTTSFERAAAVLPVRDIAAALARYRRLGFEAEAYGREPSIYGFLRRGDVRLHLACVPDLDPLTTTSAVYLYVRDADATHAEWKQAGVEGWLTAPVTTPYGLRELAYVDPDGNLLRVGSPSGD